MDTLYYSVGIIVNLPMKFYNCGFLFQDNSRAVTKAKAA